MVALNNSLTLAMNQCINIVGTEEKNALNLSETNSEADSSDTKHSVKNDILLVASLNTIRKYLSNSELTSSLTKAGKARRPGTLLRGFRDDILYYYINK